MHVATNIFCTLIFVDFIFDLFYTLQRVLINHCFPDLSNTSDHMASTSKAALLVVTWTTPRHMLVYAHLCLQMLLVLNDVSAVFLVGIQSNGYTAFFLLFSNYSNIILRFVRTLSVKPLKAMQDKIYRSSLGVMNLGSYLITLNVSCSIFFP